MTNSSPSESHAPHPSPVESHVAYLVALALGIIIGSASANKGSDFPLPAAISMAGGKLDTLAGDAIFSPNSCHWYLLEFKRTPGALVTDLEKPRVERLKAIVEFPEPSETDLIENARSAHRFIYLAEDGEHGRRLFQRSYVSWLLKDERDKQAPFVEFVGSTLFDADEGAFTFSDLAKYVDLMNQEGENSGEEVSALLAVAIEAGGQAHIIAETEFIELMNRPTPSGKMKLS